MSFSVFLRKPLKNSSALAGTCPIACLTVMHSCIFWLSPSLVPVADRSIPHVCVFPLILYFGHTQLEYEYEECHDKSKKPANFEPQINSHHSTDVVLYILCRPRVS